MPYVPALAAALVLFLFSLGLLRKVLHQAQLIRTLQTLQPVPVAASGSDLQLVKGKLEGDPLLVSPLQKRPCVYYFFRVLEPREGKQPRLLATGKEWTLAEVRDASGPARVEAWPALVASPRRYETLLENLTQIPPELSDFFERAGIDEKHLPRLPRLQVYEYTLEPGDEVYVTGSVRYENGEKVFYRKKARPLIVSADPEIGFLNGLRNEWILYAALAPLLFLASVFLALLSFNA